MNSINENGSHRLPQEFPTGLRVLVVDASLCCLTVAAKMFADFHYNVTKCGGGKEALSLLWHDTNRFDIIVSEVHLPDMHGLDLLRAIRFKTDLPVVMTSGDDREEIGLQVVALGACDFLIKPLRKDAVKFIWQHVYRKQISPSNAIVTNDGNFDPRSGSSNSTKRSRDEAETSDDGSQGKKQRFAWTSENHDLFLLAVRRLGEKEAVPSKILECMTKMGVANITRDIVSSHLQRYRLTRRKQPCETSRMANFAASNQALPYTTQHHLAQALSPQEGNGYIQYANVHRRVQALPPQGVQGVKGPVQQHILDRSTDFGSVPFSPAFGLPPNNCFLKSATNLPFIQAPVANMPNLPCDGITVTNASLPLNNHLVSDGLLNTSSSVLMAPRRENNPPPSQDLAETSNHDSFDGNLIYIQPSFPDLVGDDILPYLLDYAPTDVVPQQRQELEYNK